MAITAALCKLRNVIAIGSPLNGGLMEKISTQAVHCYTLSTLQHPILGRFAAPHAYRGQGGEA